MTEQDNLKLAISKARVSRWLSIIGGFLTTSYLATIGQLNQISATVIILITLAGIGGELYVEKLQKPNFLEKMAEKALEG